jgi:hypothetical protein
VVSQEVGEFVALAVVYLIGFDVGAEGDTGERVDGFISHRIDGEAAFFGEEPLELLLHVAVARETRRGITDAAHDAQQSGDGDREERHREDDVEKGVASR